MGILKSLMNVGIAALLAGAACSSTTAPTADEACTAQATATCAKRDMCRKNGVSLLYGSMDTCLAAAKESCQNGLAAAGTGNTPALVEACATATGAATCTDWYTNNIDACQPKVGTVAAGAVCAFNSQCASAFCSVPLGAACGTCTPTPAIGASCTGGGQCGRGQVCTNTADSMGVKTCQAPSAMGAACFATSDCTYGLECVAATKAAPGTCVSVVATAGASCNNKTGPLCDFASWLYCSIPPAMNTGTCTSYLTAMAGQPCGYAAGTGTTGGSYTECVSGSQCIIPTGKSAGTCAAPAAVGAACDTDSTKGPPCVQPARCVWSSAAGTAGTCQIVNTPACK